MSGTWLPNCVEEVKLCKLYVHLSLACAMVGISSLQIPPFDPTSMNLTIELPGLIPSDFPLP